MRDSEPDVKHTGLKLASTSYIQNKPGQKMTRLYFFLPPPLSLSSFFSHEITFPSITTPLPSMNATRDKPSQFLKESATRGCCGWKEASAISFDFREWGSH